VEEFVRVEQINEKYVLKGQETHELTLFGMTSCQRNEQTETVPYRETLRPYVLLPCKTGGKSLVLLTSDSRGTIPSLISDVIFADYFLTAPANIQCNIAFIVSCIISALVTGNRNTPGLSAVEGKRFHHMHT